MFCVFLFIRSPWGQNFIVNKATTYISDKTKTKVEIKKAYLTFDGNIKVEGLFLEDQKKDTLVYLNSLEANLPLWGTIKGTKVGVDDLKIEGLVANIIRKDTIASYNFQFLMDAFVSDNATSTVAQDTTATNVEITIGDISLRNINVVFNDAPLGIESSYKIGELETSVNKTDVENMIFEVDEIYTSESEIKYIQKPVLVAATEETPLPNLSAQKITLKKTKLFYKSEELDILTDLNITDFSTDKIQLNLENSVFDIQNIALRDSDIRVEMTASNNDETVNKNQTEFLWPEVALAINKINFVNNTISYRVNNTEIKQNVFDANAIGIQNLNLKASDINYKQKKGNLRVQAFSFNESVGFTLKELTFDANFSDQEININAINFSTLKNRLVGNMEMDYNSISELIASPDRVSVNLKLPTINIDINEFLAFQPNFKKNLYINEVRKKQISGQLYASGFLSDIQVSNSTLFWGNTTQIALSGVITNPTDVENLKLDIPNFKAQTVRKDIVKFVDEKSLGLQLPEKMLLTGQINGGINQIKTNLKLASTQGNIILKGGFENAKTINFNADVSVENYKVGQLLKNDALGELTLNIKTKGQGTAINTLDATLNANLAQFQFNDYAIKGLALNGNFKQGKGNLSSSYKDKNLNLKLKALVDLDSIETKANLNLAIIGADLQGLGFMQRNVKTGMNISVDFAGNLDAYQVDATVKDGAVVYDEKTFLIGQVKAKGFVAKDTTAVTLKNKMIDLSLASNTDPKTFGNSLQQHVSSYFYRDIVLADTLKKPVNLELKAKIVQTPLLSEVFLVNVKDIDTIKVVVDFNEIKRKLNAEITAPHINYNDNEIDSLNFKMDTDKENFNFKLGFKDIVASPLDVPKTIITGNQTNNVLSLNFSGYHNEETLMNVNAKITGNRERLSFKVNPEKLILNKHIWAIPNDNEVVFENNNSLSFNNFRITKGNQSINVTDKLSAISKNHIALEYDNFKISEVFNYLNPEKEITKGILNGNFVLEQPFGDTGIIANLNINQLEVLKTNFGKLTLDAKSLGGNTYDFKAKLDGGDVDLNLTGDYVVENKDANLNLDLIINQFKMKALNTLSLGEIKEAQGSFSGNFKVMGKVSKPKYNGDIKFNNADFKVTKLNTKFTLVNEQLKMNNNGLFMSNFTVLDAKKNKLVLSGNIGTKSFVNPTFNLSLKADNFRVLNASKEDNPSLYGLATFNANAELGGDLQIPKLTANVTLGSDTDVTYVLPASYANIEKRDDVVVFVNRENPDAILTKTEEQSAIITGFDVFTKFKVNKEAAVTVVIDENTGDNFKVSGDGDFIFNMIPNGRISLTGAFEVADGHYELNLYGLVNRKFNLAPGGRITWSGDPFDANLNVSAIYKLETTAAPLMAAQISNEDPSVKNKFKQVLPFNVYLNIDGDLLQPKISFNLAMPEEEKGAIGGQVYGRVQQVNQQEEELNKQVFSLLVLNRFYPNSGSDGSSGGFATIARDNLNDAVSGQLNAFSDKILGNAGVELNFDLNSYTDFQGATATDRTQLGVTAQKKLFNDRLTVRVGSDVNLQGSNTTEQAAPLIGNVSLEYKITEDGRYRLKGFRKSEFENVIDGQTIISGVALIFTQEFNEFKEMWDAIFRSQKEKQEQEKELAAQKLKEKKENVNKSIEKKKN